MLVTKDEDFAERSRLRLPARAVFWLRLGNLKKSDLRAKLSPLVPELGQPRPRRSASGLARLLKCASDPLRISSAIEHSTDYHFTSSDSIVDRIRETLREKTVAAEPRAVDSSVEDKRIDLGKQTIEKIAANPLALTVVEFSSGGWILERRTKDPNVHSNRFRSSFFASSQSKISTRPATNSASVLRNSSACHAGLSKDSSSAARSLQSVSIIFSFSSRGSLRSSAMLIARV